MTKTVEPMASADNSMGDSDGASDLVVNEITFDVSPLPY